MARTRKTLGIGSISEGTTIARDIAESLAHELAHLRLTRTDRAKLNELTSEFEQGERVCDDDCRSFGCTCDGDEDTASEILYELTDLAQSYVPDYCAIGMHHGDGADFGVWPDWDAIDIAESEGEVCKLMSGVHPSELSSLNSTFALATNDHGNATLYRRAGNRWVECWAVV